MISNNRVHNSNDDSMKEHLEEILIAKLTAHKRIKASLGSRPIDVIEAANKVSAASNELYLYLQSKK